MKKTCELIKRIIPAGLKTKIKYLLKLKHIKAIEKRSRKKDKLSVSILIMFAENWNSLKSFYFSCVRKNIECKVIVSPCVDNDGSIDLKQYTEACDFFEEQNIPYIRAYDIDSKTTIKYEEIATDYIFYDKPYNSYVDGLKFNQISRYSKICYIPYGFILTDSEKLLNLVLSDFFLMYNYILFASWDKVANYARNRYKSMGVRKANVVELGYPRFDLLNKENNSSEGNFTVLWTPRWESNDKQNNINNTSFSSLSYKSEIVNRIENYKTEDWIVRPHPLAFYFLKKYKIMTEQDVEDFIKKINSFENSCMDNDKDYLDAFYKSSCIVTDFSSLIIEYCVMNKPIIYCGDLNAIPLKLLRECLYVAKNWEEVNSCLNQIKLGIDPLQDKRKEFIRSMQSDGKIGERILDYLICDFNKKKKSKNKEKHNEKKC